jgi:hypothetical protein
VVLVDGDPVIEKRALSFPSEDEVVAAVRRRLKHA